eukprot:TRINITY_DN3182_c0_g2_i1.p1 TRINITY_DN3182_c0_g2~~TRINITY_DN3182_c0_g2_i1.p1  ORF type:complete len:792 (+),score=273.57 TRINITY_DN3182_c0_g2_i1:130-2505(+)
MDFTRLVERSSAKMKGNGQHLPIPAKSTSSAPSSPCLSIIEDYSSPEGSFSSNIGAKELKSESLRTSYSSDLDPLTMAAMQREMDGYEDEIFNMDTNASPSKASIQQASGNPPQIDENFMYSNSSLPPSSSSSVSSPQIASIDGKKSLSTLATMFQSPKKTHRRSFSQNSTPFRSNSPSSHSSLSTSQSLKASPKSVHSTTSSASSSSSSLDFTVGEVKTVEEKEEKKRLTQSHSFTSTSNAPLKKSPSGSKVVNTDSSSMLSRLFGISSTKSPSDVPKSPRENSEGRLSGFFSSSRNSSTNSLGKLEEEESIKESMREALKESLKESLKELSNSGSENKEKREENKKKANSIFDISNPFWHREDRIGQLMFLVFLSFVLGYFRLPFWSIFVIIYGLHVVDRHRQLKWKEAKKVHHKKQSDSSENKQKSETTKWLNVISCALFPYISHNIAESTKNTLKVLLTSALEQRKPAVVESISVSHISYGNTPAIFTAIAGTRPPHTDFSFDLDLTYQGPLQIVVDVLLGGKFVNLRLPISIQDFNLSGRLRLDLSFFAKSPYLHTYKYSFLQLPSLTCSIKPMRGVNVLDFPFVESWIFDSMSYVIKTTCVLPSQISVPFHLGFTAAGEEVPVKPVLIRETNKKLDIFSDSDSDSSEQIPEDNFHSVLLLRVVEAKLNIKDKALEKCTPVFTIVNGSEVINSTKPVYGASKQPIWNELIQIAVKKDSTKIVEVSIKTPVPNSPMLRLLGRTVLRLDSLTPDTTIDIWYPLTDDFRSDLGKVHLILRYLPSDASTS